MKRLLIAVAVVAVLAVSAIVARWINNDTVERGKVTELLRAQADGRRGEDAHARRLPRRSLRARSSARTRAKLRGRGDLKIALYQSQTAHALRSRTKPTRVVWFTPGRLTTVQCVLVRAQGERVRRDLG